MIQGTNSHIRRLFNEKMQAEEELQECKERVKNHIENVFEQREYLGQPMVKKLTDHSKISLILLLIR